MLFDDLTSEGGCVWKNAMGNFEKSISRGSKVQGEGTRLEISQKVNMRNLHMFRLKANQIHRRIFQEPKKASLTIKNFQWILWWNYLSRSKRLKLVVGGIEIS